ncbi:hypothetical protein P875_00108778 [Aspergillus parasiticus SU-1]|uniref:Uncharacterized protein n=1 Tax=Aspergillus parasiticus (strain ATCC 56775 / NRRL 5862 / SRRC 143 / SU-1) TaxID=1403190 RepID=A0A0F0ILG3_ASPPU|nr:hypothetical protein P875_00108778 [Aspergillus parasiticus SU-1]
MQILFSIPLLLLGTAYALPSIQHQHHAIPNATWEFSVYQNDHCTGEITLFSGTKSISCRDAILNGGALSYIPDKITDSHCRVHLFNDNHCSGNRTVSVFGKDIRPTCRVPRWGGITFCPEFGLSFYTVNIALRSGLLWRISDEVEFYVYEYVPSFAAYD